jgi:uncharacterized membrane protein YhiD involved in acid resistance
MPPFDLSAAVGGAQASVPQLPQLFLRMLLASLLGAFIAYRLWRRFMPFTSPPSLQGAQTQTLIASAGALMVVVIGDNMARAFGLVGLGAFIRFRSGIGDPRDAAIMFVMIGIGMACGLGLPLMAVGATVFISLLLIIFDATNKTRSKRTTVVFNALNPPEVCPAISAMFPNTRVIEVSALDPALGKESGRLVLELDLRGNMDAATIRQMLEQKGVPGITRVALTE